VTRWIGGSVQKPREDAYRGIYEMQRTGRLLAWLAVFVT